ncbi:MAG: MdlB, multidrug/protein/lipid transporter ATPase, ATP-binding cassette, subfamily bacterial [Candidatus Saccharibacteria bacterium]|nr:MdlB, multidrug/protein/lipid transporter ATPase, ATP-binding cassette, subfamily bacterial [Candidatus Saccharibacteria bacterium]
MQRKTLSLFWKIAQRYPLHTWVAILNSGFTSVIGGFIAPYVIAHILTLVQSDSLNFTTGLPLLITYTIIQLYAQLIGGRINLYMAWTMESSGQRDLYQIIFNKLTTHSLGFHANRFGGALVSQTTKLVGSFERFWDTIIWQLIPSIASIIAGIVILSFVFWQYAIALAIISVIFVLVVVVGSNSMKKTTREEAQAMTAANGYVADVVTNISTVKAYGSEDFEQKNMLEKANFFRSKSRMNMHRFLGVSSAYSGLIMVLYISVFIAAIWASEYHLISIASIYLAITYSFTIGRQLWEMNSILRNYNRLIGDAHDMVEILDLAPSVVDKGTNKLQVTKGDVEFQNVTFTHQDNNDALFKDFNLVIPKGQRVGIVGHSGSGKTTLTRLLLRFSDIEDGKILIDDQDISEVTQKSLHHSIAYVPQEPMLFHRSLRDNIAYGNSSAADAEVERAARLANATEFIDALPLGFETLVGERGVKLSGGQRQRIAIARAILKDSPILVLDEATSALDSDSEKLIQDALQKLMKGRTSIVIAHRLSTIAKLDRIILLEDGMVVEDGSHAELLKENGIYAKLWSHQSGGFIDED